VSDTFEFIDAEYADNLSQNMAEAPPIAKMCVWLDVSRSGYYEWVCHERGRELDVGRAS
jgi:putative transposase